MTTPTTIAPLPFDPRACGWEQFVAPGRVQILAVLYDEARPLTALAIVRRVARLPRFDGRATPRAYTTVTTQLLTLVRSGLVARSGDRATGYRYAPALPEPILWEHLTGAVLQSIGRDTVARWLATAPRD